MKSIEQSHNFKNHTNMPRNLYPVVRLVNFFMLDVDLKCFKREKKNKRALIEHQPSNSQTDWQRWGAESPTASLYLQQHHRQFLARCFFHSFVLFFPFLDINNLICHYLIGGYKYQGLHMILFEFILFIVYIICTLVFILSIHFIGWLHIYLVKKKNIYYFQ